MKILKKISIGLLAIAAILLILDTGCVFYHMTGLPCPGCGMTRAYLAALRLDFSEAFRMHPLWPVTVPLIILSLWKNGRIFRSGRVNTAFYLLFLLIYLVVYAVRMVCLFPDTAPMLFDADAALPILLRWIQKYIMKGCFL